MKQVITSLILMLFIVSPIICLGESQNTPATSSLLYADAFRDLQPGWTSETIYQTNPLGPASICETGTNEVLVLDKASSEIVELELNGSLSTYLPLGDISLDAIAFQTNANRVIGIGDGAFYTLNTTSIHVIKEHPPNVTFSNLVVDPSDDSIYTGHWMNDSSIYHFDVNGEFISTVRTGILGCAQLAVDSAQNLLYYSETFPGRITKLNMTTNTTSVLTSGIAIPGTGEGISIATDPLGNLYYLVAEGTEKGLHKYNGTAFEFVMPAKLGIGAISWSNKFNSFLGTPGYGACVVQFDPAKTEAERITPTVNTRAIIETSDGLLLIGLEKDIFRIESGTFTPFISELPYPCGGLTLDGSENIYASLSNDSVLILKVFPDGSNSTWFQKDLKGFPNGLVYDSKNNLMIQMTNNFQNGTFDLWRLPVESPYDYSKIATIENATSGDLTVDRSGNIYVLERSENILYKIPDQTDIVETVAINVVEHAFLVYPHIAYSTHADAVILCRNDDLQAWPVNGSSSYILGVSATGIDHEGLFENAERDLVGTHSGQIFKLHYEESASATTPSTTTEPTTHPVEPPSIPFEMLAIVVGAMVVIIAIVVCVKLKR
ncbi:MAG: hypothetical protein ACFFE2_14220 [Candidatus Thorarchaeota archaeon]